ncbi:MAG TPA: hypothetical protein VK989_05555, partial [Polyangia bacterium]|nr:hypothetical protein [Polyangia bacterium]
RRIARGLLGLVGLVGLATGGLGIGACGFEGNVAGDEPGVTTTTSAIVNATNTTDNERYWGDYNGDGTDDLIIVTAGGSYEYLGVTGGGFTPNVWVRNDLTLGHVAFIPGRFHGPGPTDVLIVTAGGTYEYEGKSGGGFTPNVWVRNDLTLGNVQYTVGDWDADLISDLIITTAGGSYQYMGRSTGVFTPNTWVRTTLPLGTVKYTVRHVGVEDDVIITTDGTRAPGGSFLYLGNIGATGFTLGSWSRSDLTLGKVALVAGNWSGPGADLLITTASGTSLDMNIGGRYYTPGVYVRSDWTLGQVKFTRGNFDHAGGGDDLIITVASGSYEYTTNSGNGTAFDGFNVDQWVRHDLPLGKVDYFTGHFSGVSTPDSLIIMTAGGSYEYLGANGGGFIGNAWVRTNLPLGNVQYF